MLRVGGSALSLNGYISTISTTAWFVGCVSGPRQVVYVGMRCDRFISPNPMAGFKCHAKFCGCAVPCLHAHACTPWKVHESAYIRADDMFWLNDAKITNYLAIVSVTAGNLKCSWSCRPFVPTIRSSHEASFYFSQQPLGTWYLLLTCMRRTPLWHISERKLLFKVRVKVRVKVRLLQISRSLATPPPGSC